MINVTYTQNGEAVVDDMLETWAKGVVADHAMCQGTDIDISIGCGSMVDMLRVFLKRGTISANEINFYTSDGIRVGPDEACIFDWPVGFADKQDKLLDELLGI
jgi:hypothetical protein